VIRPRRRQSHQLDRCRFQKRVSSPGTIHIAPHWAKRRPTRGGKELGAPLRSWMGGVTPTTFQGTPPQTYGVALGLRPGRLYSVKMPYVSLDAKRTKLALYQSAPGGGRQNRQSPSEHLKAAHRDSNPIVPHRYNYKTSQLRGAVQQIPPRTKGNWCSFSPMLKHKKRGAENVRGARTRE